MPIEIPKLQQIQPTQTQQSYRMKQNVKSQAGLITGRVDAINKVVSSADKAHTSYENQEIDKLGTEAELMYTSWQNETLRKLKEIKDDPTKAYADYEVEENKVVDEILAKYPDSSDRVKQGVTQRIVDLRNGRRETVLKQRGAQLSQYKHNLHLTGRKLRVDNLAVNVSNVYAGNESSFTYYQSQLDDLKSHEVKNMLRMKTAFIVDDPSKADHTIYRPPIEEGGKPVAEHIAFTELGANEWAKERSDAATKSLEVLLNMGRTKDAEAFYDKFKKYIDPLNAAKLDKRFNVAKVEDEAYMKAAEISRLPIEKRQEAVDKIKDNQVREKTDKLLIAQNERIKSRRQAKEEKNFNYLSSKVMERMESNNPYSGYVQLQGEQIYKETWDNMSNTQKQAIKEMIEAPKNSNVSSWHRVQNIFFGEDPNNELGTMTPQEFEYQARGLNKADKEEARKTFQRLRIESAGEERAVFKSVGYKLEQRMIADEIIEKNPKTGFYDAENMKMLVEAKSNLMANLEKQSGKMTEVQQDLYVKEYIAKIYKKKLTPITEFIPSFGRRKGEPKKGDISDFDLSAADRRKFKLMYANENDGVMPSNNDKKLYEFIKNKRTR